MNKKTDMTMKLNPYFKDTIETSNVVWSHDENSYQFNFDFTNYLCDKPFELTDGKPRILLEFLNDSNADIQIYPLEIESEKLGQAHFIIPDKILGYVGDVKASLTIDFDDKSHDLGSFYFRMKKSPIDEKMPELQFWVDEFDQAFELFKHGLDEFNEDIKESNAKVDEIKDLIVKNDVFKSSDFAYQKSNKTSPNTPKILNIDNGIYKIYTNAPSGKHYIYFELKKGAGDPSKEESFGNDFGLMRLTAVYSYKNIVCFKQPESIETPNHSNGQPIFQKSNFVTGYNSPQNLDYWSSVNRESQGMYMTFDVEISREHNGRIDIGFYGTKNTNQNVEVYLNDVLVDTVDTSSPTNTTVFKNINIGSFIGKGKMKLQVKDDNNYNKGFHFLGYNCVELKNLPRTFDLTGVLINFNPDKHYITKTTGANEYALRDSETGKWFGSFHGGEKEISKKIILDGQEISEVNMLRTFNELKIIQQTSLIDKIISNSITTFSENGTYEIEGFLEPKNTINLSDFYACMTCSNDEYSNIIFPKIATVSKSDNTLYLPNSSKVVQFNESNSNTITTEYTPMKKYYTNTPTRILFFENLYSKLYFGQSTGQNFTFESTIFGNRKIFD